MEYTRSRYLIQHRESERYIKASTDHNGKLELTPDGWKAWGMQSAEEALHVLHENPYMPEDTDSYRIVKTIDQREVEENEPLSKDS